MRPGLVCGGCQPREIDRAEAHALRRLVKSLRQVLPGAVKRLMPSPLPEEAARYI